MKTWRRKRGREEPIANHGGVCVELALVTMQDGRKVPVVYPFKVEHASFTQKWLDALIASAAERTTNASSS